MKRFVPAVLWMALLLSGCAQPQNQTGVPVCIEQTDGCTVAKDCQTVQPGQDAEFILELDRGLSLAGTDYDGDTSTHVSKGKTILTVKDVRFPTRIRLSLTRRYAQITYDANGGTGAGGGSSRITVDYSLENHARPNTDNGTALFTREGHTLVCWNTRPDGSGTRVGLGSRVSIPDGTLTLYAQWEPWSDPSDFDFLLTDQAAITRYHGSAKTVVVPERIHGREVTRICSGAFENAGVDCVILPKTVDVLEPNAFENCAMERLVLFDNVVSFSDESFSGCDRLQTLYLNAAEAPFGYTYRKESCYADKVDMLIAAQGHPKLVFYGGCSMWYNLDGFLVFRQLGMDYTIINLGLNGTVNSMVQMQILGHFLEPGDILFHTPELSSRHQMLTQIDMESSDKSLWCGIENNYDLFALVDLRTLGGVFDSLHAYLERKDEGTGYTQYYMDDSGNRYMDAVGSIPFPRVSSAAQLEDRVFLDPGRITPESTHRLSEFYRWYQQKGVRVYLSYACINMDAVPPEQQDDLAQVEQAFRSAVEAMDGPVLISRIEDFLYTNGDFYDTNYHLLTEPARKNTAVWLEDLLAQMEKDGLWKGDTE